MGGASGMLRRGAMALVVLGMAAGPALADADGVAKKMDDALNAGPNQTWRFKVTTVEPGKDKRVLEMAVHQKGEKRLTEFLKPGDVKGTKVLSLSHAQMYIYLPAYDKVRRVASHMTKSGFMGTTYSEAEMSLTHYTPVYAFTLKGEDGKTSTIVGTPKPDAKAAYPKIEIVVRKDNNHPDEIRYFNESGQMVKSEERTEYSCQSGICNARLMKMTDHTRAGMHTTFERIDWKPQAGHPDSKFSKRALTRR